MKNPFLIGQNIYLKPLEMADLNDIYISWLNDPEVCEFNSHHVFPYNQEKAEQYFKKIHLSQSDIVLAIVDNQSEEHVGNIALQNIDFFNQNAEIAFLLGNKKFWGKGVGYEAAILLMKHGFITLGLHRIYCGTFRTNTRMQRLALKLGMSEEGCRKQAAFKNGQFVDIVEYGIVGNDFNLQLHGKKHQ